MDTLTKPGTTGRIQFMGDQERVPHQNEANTANKINSYFESTFDPDDELRRDQLGQIDERDFITMLEEVNAIIRGKPKGAIQPLDGEGVVLVSHAVPHDQDKETLLKQIWSGVRMLLTDPNLDAEESLAYAAALTGLGILYIHPFNDSNGRTARTLSRFIRGGMSELEVDLVKILSEDGGNYEPLVNLNFPRYIDHAVPNSSPQLDDRELAESMKVVASINYSPDDNDVIDLQDIPKDQDIIENFQKSTVQYYVMMTFLRHIDKEGYDTVMSFIDDNNTLQFGLALKALASSEKKGLIYMSEFREADRYVRSHFIERFVKAITSGAAAPLGSDELDIIMRVKELQLTQPPLSESSKAFGRMLLGLVQEGGRTIPVRDLMVLNMKSRRP